MRRRRSRDRIFLAQGLATVVIPPASHLVVVLLAFYGGIGAGESAIHQLFIDAIPDSWIDPIVQAGRESYQALRNWSDGEGPLDQGAFVPGLVAVLGGMLVAMLAYIAILSLVIVVLLDMRRRSLYWRDQSLLERIVPDRRPAVVYLRSFDRDRTDQRPIHGLHSLPISFVEEDVGGATIGLIFGRSREDRWARRVERICGPVIALDQPTAMRRKGGVVRVSAGENWRDDIKARIHDAALVILLSDDEVGHGLRWEIDYLRANVAPGKIITNSPGEFVGDVESARAVEPEPDSVSAMAKELIVGGLELEDLDLFRFTDDWRPVAHTSVWHALDGLVTTAPMPSRADVDDAFGLALAIAAITVAVVGFSLPFASVALLPYLAAIALVLFRAQRLRQTEGEASRHR